MNESDRRTRDWLRMLGIIRMVAEMLGIGACVRAAQATEAWETAV